MSNNLHEIHCSISNFKKGKPDRLLKQYALNQTAWFSATCMLGNLADGTLNIGRSYRT